jgi:hypothetical protein
MLRFLSAALKSSLFLCLVLTLAACNLPGQPPAGPDPVIKLQATSSEKGYGSAVLTIVRGFGAPDTTHSIITGTVELGIVLDPAMPTSGTVIGTGKGQADTLIVATGPGGTHKMSGVWPVEFEVSGKFITDQGQPACTLILTIDEFVKLSETVMVHSSVIGDVPAAGGEDTFTTIKDITLKSIDPDETKFIDSAQSTFSIDDVRLPEWVYCTFMTPDIVGP